MPRRTPNQSAAPIEADSLHDYWNEVAPKKSCKRAVGGFSCPVDNFRKWALQLHTSSRLGMQVLPGQSRSDFFREYLDPSWEAFRPDTIEDVTGPDTLSWIAEGILPNFTRRVLNLPFPTSRTWGSISAMNILWALILNEDFMVEDPLKSKVDREFHIAHTLYKMLWEARFLVREKQGDIQGFVGSLIRWMTASALEPQDLKRLESIGIRRRLRLDSEKADVLFFLLTVAAQNALFNRALFSFDNLEYHLGTNQRQVWRQIEVFLEDVDRWVKLGCPVGIVLGFDAYPPNMDSLRKSSPKLYGRVKQGLVWAR